EWVHVQLHQQKGMISLSPPTICNSAHQSFCVFSDHLLVSNLAVNNQAALCRVWQENPYS
ncbi:hypothetical protein OFB78_25320, partial [Escherichia coli]|nr:hypothetical protein [Escherichia coli]